MRRSLVLGAALILTLSLSACNNDNNTKDDTIHVESVSVASIHELEVGETFTVGTNTVTVLPDNATDKSYSLSSGDTDVFTTSGYVITAVGEGSATLTVTTTDGGFTDWTTITVKGDTEQEPGPEQGGGTGGDDQPGTGGEGGDGGDTGGEGGGTEPGPSEPDKDVTITTNPTSITVKGGETASFTISVTDGASILSVVSDNEAVVVSGSDTDWTVTATNNGDENITATITITAGGTGFNTATATLPVTVTPADNYTYTLSLDNTASVPTDWYYDTDASFEIAGTLHVLNRGTEEVDSAITLTSANTTVTVNNDDGNAEGIINVSGLTISPAGGVGQVVVTVTYSADDPSGAQGASQSFSIEVQERYTTTHEIKINQGSVPSTTQVGASEFDIAATLTTTTTAGSTGDPVAAESGSRDLTDEDVSNGNVTITCNPADAFTINGRHAIPNGSYDFEDNDSVEVTFTVIWAEYVEDEGDAVTDSATTTLSPKEGAVYTMTLTNETELTDTWHSEDEARTASLTLVSSDPEEDPVPTIENIINENQLVVNITGESITNGTGNDILTFTPVKSGTSLVVIYWSEHTEAHVSFSVAISDYSYEISITNKEALQESWSIEDAEERTLSVSLETDREDIETTVSTDNVEVTYDESVFTTSDGGFTLTPQGTAEAGDYTITVEWIDESIKEDLRVSDTVVVTLDDTIKVTNISLDQTSISWDAPSSTTITATLTGKDGATPTNQGVTWSVSGDSTIALSANTGSSVTVTASAYNASATVTAVSDDNPTAYAVCTVNVSAQPAVEAKLTQEAVTPTTVASPDNRGVYVIGTETGSEYITYSSNTFSTTESYDDAVAIRTIPAENAGEYYLAVGEYYINNSLTVTDAEPTTAFTISTDGISLGNSQIYINSGLSTSGSSAAHLIDMALVESTSMVSSGEYYLYGVHTNYNPAFFNGSTSSNKLSTTDDISNAVKVTIENLGGNEYYMKYGNNYISVGSSSDAGYSTTAAKIYYDSTNDVWQNSDGSRYLGTNLSSNNVVFGSYQYSSGNLNNSYKAVGLYDSDALPNIKGVGISTEEYSVGISSTINMHGSVYPSCLTTESVSWSSSNESYATVDSNGIVTGVSATDSVTITATDGGYSDSVSITVEDIIPDYMANETIDFTGDMSAYGWTVSSGTQTEIPSETHFQLFTFSQVSSSTKNSLWSESLRIYSGGTITITPTAYQIEKIEFTFTNANHSWASDDTITNGTASEYGAASITVTPTDTSKAVSIYNNGTKWSSGTSDTAQRRITKMVVYYINEFLVVS